MNGILSFSRQADDLFVHVPPALNRDYLEAILSRYLGQSIRILEANSENVRASYYFFIQIAGDLFDRCSFPDRAR